MLKEFTTAVLFSLAVNSAAAAGEDVLLPATVERQVRTSSGETVIEKIPAVLAVPSRLIMPLAVTGGLNPILVTTVYEYCSRKEVGAKTELTSEYRALLINAAIELATYLEKYGYSEEANFYEKCAMRY